MYVTQPAISRQINALEKELQIKIFERNTHSVSLTAEGERFCKYAKDVADSMERLMEAYKQNTENNKSFIKIGVFPFYKAAGLSTILNSFFSMNHNVIGSIKVVENYKAFEMLENGSLDFLIIKSRPEHIPDWVKYDVLKEEALNVLISANSSFAEKDNIPVKELGNLPLLTGETSTYFYEEMKDFYTSNSINFNVAFMNTKEVDIMLDMVGSEVGILLATDEVAKNYNTSTVKAIPISPKQEFITYIAYSPKKKLRGVYLTFKDYIISEFGEK